MPKVSGTKRCVLRCRHGDASQDEGNIDVIMHELEGLLFVYRRLGHFESVLLEGYGVSRLVTEW